MEIPEPKYKVGDIVLGDNVNYKNIAGSISAVYWMDSARNFKPFTSWFYRVSKGTAPGIGVEFQESEIIKLIKSGW
jgi:hypothetical protein